MYALLSSTLRRLVAAVMLTMSLIPLALAQSQGPELRVATSVIPPFVIRQGDHLTGFSVELWNEVAARLKLRTSYQVMPDIGALIEAVKSQQADLAVSGVFITAERDKVVDFSVSTLNSGLQVMVRDMSAGGGSSPLRDILALLFSRSAAIWIAVGLAIVLVPAHVVWMLDRGKEDGVSPGKSYFPGIFHAMVWAFTALVSQVQQLPNQWGARVFGLLWMFAGVVFIALYTAQLTATLTVEQIHGVINGPADLPGKKVGTLTTSRSAAYLSEIQAEPQEFVAPDELFQALLDGKLDAVVLNAATLHYYAAHEGMGRVKLVGPEFRKSDVGIVFPLDSPLRRQVNAALLELRENGTYEELYAKWFGSE